MGTSNTPIFFCVAQPSNLEWAVTATFVRKEAKRANRAYHLFLWELSLGRQSFLGESRNRPPPLGYPTSFDPPLLVYRPL